jgi:hypothetical protein
MMRTCYVLLALALCGCRHKEPPLDLFAETVAGVWHRTSVRELSSSETPDPVPRTEVNRIQAASYDGPGKLGARVYELTSSGVGLDLVQRWRPSADTVFFYQGRYFVVIKWEGADRKALQAFIRELEERLKSGTPSP